MIIFKDKCKKYELSVISHFAKLVYIHNKTIIALLSAHACFFII